MADEMIKLKKMSRGKGKWWRTIAITGHKYMARFLASSEHCLYYNTRIVHNKRTGKYYVQIRDEPMVEK